MGSLCSPVPQEELQWGWGARARDLAGVAGREVEPRDPDSLKNQDKGSESLDPTMFLI